MKKISICLLLLTLLSAGVYIGLRKSNRTLLIIGCARSGTNYISTVFQNSDLDIKHEKMGKDGVSSWVLSAEPKFRKRGVKMANYHFDHILHQVRHPLGTISSVYFTENSQSWDYIIKNTPEINIWDSHLVKCAKYWYYWNLKSEKLAEWTYRIEDLDNLWDDYCRRIGKKLSRTAIERVPKNVNTRGAHRAFTWEDLHRELDPELYRNIVDLARKYGYSAPAIN